MSQKYTIMALDRRSIGHPNYFRAGRSWPSGQEVEVLVLDQDEDPVVTEEHKGENRTFVHPTQIGRKSWDIIRADRQLIKQPVGATIDEALQLQASYDAAKAELARTITRAEMAEKALSDSSASVADLHAAIRDANEKIEVLEGKFQVAVTRAESAEASAGKLTQERDELLKQIEQLTAPPSAESKVEASTKIQGKAQKRGG